MRIALILTLGLALPLLAQDKAKAADKPAEKAKTPSMADMMPKPGPEMAKVKAMLGSWDVEETHEPGPFGPGGKGKGMGTVSPGPGGLSMRINYRTTEGHMKGFAGHGVLAWDEPSKTYKQSWVDNMTPGLMVGTGHWEGDKFIMNTEATMMGKPFKGRDTFSDFTKDGFTLTSEMSLDGSPMAKVMTLVHKRRAEPAAPTSAPAAKDEKK